MPIKNMRGDLFQTKAKFICHQVNCQGKMGSGVAKHIRERFPFVYKHYKDWCDNAPAEKLLGRTQIIYVGEDGQTTPTGICNMFAQDSYGHNGECYTNYTAFQRCLQSIKRQIPYNTTIAMPYRIGCGLGGGDWGTVMRLILEELSPYYTVELWRLER